MRWCDEEHTVHVAPNQQVPERFWVTCGEETLAELLTLDAGNPSQEFLATWFESVMNEHMGGRADA